MNTLVLLVVMIIIIIITIIIIQILYMSACQQRVAYNRRALNVYISKSGLETNR
jgi:predicted Holliday junction resolvase-like endonuclease